MCLPLHFEDHPALVDALLTITEGRHCVPEWLSTEHPPYINVTEYVYMQVVALVLESHYITDTVILDRISTAATGTTQRRKREAFSEKQDHSHPESKKFQEKRQLEASAVAAGY